MMMAIFFSYEDSRVTYDKPKRQRTAFDDGGGCDDGDSVSLSEFLEMDPCAGRSSRKAGLLLSTAALFFNCDDDSNGGCVSQFLAKGRVTCDDSNGGGQIVTTVTLVTTAAASVFRCSSKRVLAVGNICIRQCYL